MNNALDPIKILVCGGHAVGKTTILRRLSKMQFPDTYERTLGLNAVNFFVALNNNGVQLKVNIFDIGAGLLDSRHRDSALFTELTTDLDAVLLVVDGTKLESMKESDAWIEFLDVHITRKVVKYLLVHKADLPRSLRVITPKNLDVFVKHSGIDGWSLTVGHPALGDLDINRGSWIRQKPPEDIIKRVVSTVLLRRQSNLFKIIPPDFNLEFSAWKSYGYEDINCFINS